jgi:hypothetical protein
MRHVARGEGEYPKIVGGHLSEKRILGILWRERERLRYYYLYLDIFRVEATLANWSLSPLLTPLFSLSFLDGCTALFYPIIPIYYCYVCYHGAIASASAVLFRRGFLSGGLFLFSCWLS